MTEEPGDGLQPPAESLAKADLARQGSERNLISHPAQCLVLAEVCIFD